MPDFPIPDWSRIDVVCLDMDGTVLDLHFDNYFWEEFVPARYGELHGLSAAEASVSHGGAAGTTNPIKTYSIDEVQGLVSAVIKELVPVLVTGTRENPTRRSRSLNRCCLCSRLVYCKQKFPNWKYRTNKM